jgi:hypothetical protein
MITNLYSSTIKSESIVNTTPPPQPQQPMTTTMTASELRFSLNLIKTLMKHKRAIAFLNPVDPIAFNIPDYFDVIKNPMDLGTVDQKLKTHQYPTLDHFINDIQLIFDNCYLYNNAGDPVCQDAKKLEESFKKQLKKVSTLNQPPPPSVPQQQQPTKIILSTTTSHTIPSNNIVSYMSVLFVIYINHM